MTLSIARGSREKGECSYRDCVING